MIDKTGAPGAFRQRLDAKLRTRAREEGVDTARLYRRVTIECFLGRLIAVGAMEWTLKGGVALDMRIGNDARFSRDIDIETTTFERLLPLLQQAAHTDLGDHATFVLRYRGQEDDVHVLNLRCEIGGHLFEEVRVELAAPTLPRTPESIVIVGHLSFAGICSDVVVPIIPVEAHFAEKFHAYTRKWPGRENTRVKDLPDMLLLATRCKLDEGLLRVALRDTFAARATHALPSTVPDPPTFWARRYVGLARNTALPPTLDEAVASLREYLAPILASI